MIKKFFSVEFTRFNNYYKKSKDLNIEGGRSSYEEDQKDSTRYFINIGSKDDFDWMTMKDFLKDLLNLGKDDVYKVDVKDSFSFFNTDDQHQELVMSVFSEFELEGRRVSVEISKIKVAAVEVADVIEEVEIEVEVEVEIAAEVAVEIEEEAIEIEVVIVIEVDLKEKATEGDSKNEVPVKEMINQSFQENDAVDQTIQTLKEREANAVEEYKILLNFVPIKLWHEIMI